MSKYFSMQFIRILLVFFSAVSFVGCTSTSTVGKLVGPSEVASKKLKDKSFPFGLNQAGGDFGQNMPGVINVDYGYPTEKQLDYMKSKGLTMVRFPFKWERIQRELGGPLDQVELKRMKTFVDAARDRDMWIILDMHNYCRRKINGTTYIIGETPEVSVEAVADAWGKLATEFKGYSNIWGYGVMNEPHDMLPSTPWFTIAQACINSIRKADPETAILIGGDSWSSAERWMEFSDNLKDLKDPADNLVYEVHVYFDNDASGSYKKSYEEELASPTTGITRFAPFLKWLKDNNKRGFVGEYGVPDDDPRWLVTLDVFLKHLQENCINGTYWAAGPRWGKYRLAVEPRNGEERPQMQILEKYKIANTNCK